MVEFATTTMSSKGQIVIPRRLRKGMEPGQQFAIIREEDRIVLIATDELDEKLAEDLEFARRTELAWQRIEAGKGTTMDFDEFIEEIKKW